MNDSPVDTSYFKANNMLTLNSPSNKTLAEGKSDYSSEVNKTQIEGIANLNGFTFAKTRSIIIQNSVVYGSRLESGYSSQAPNGIFARNEEKTRRILSKRIKI